MFIAENSGAVSTISSLIQLSVAPVFLLAGVAGLLNVFAGRLIRIVDKLERIDNHIHNMEEKDPHFVEDERTALKREFLLKRMSNINFAIFFGTATGLMVALVILTVFFSSLLSFHGDGLIAGFFITAMIFLVLSLVLFLKEIYYTTDFIKNKKSHLE